ncbi:MFS transporter [Coralliovum pocilloporae]|uniref:MFS transporter n=1 Tax=Coralliovum pocilloporae TaxID=3066369 RepID=UPI0033069EB2
MGRLTLVPLFMSAGLLLGGNGLVGTLIPIRAGLEGFSTTSIGFFGSAYFVGFVLGCLFAPRLVARVGHIRAFSTAAALVACGALVHAMVVNIPAWIIIRGVTGFCFASLFLVMESWLNEKAKNSGRGKTLSIYRLVDLACVSVGQYLLLIAPPGGFEIFSLIAILFAVSLIPISISRQPSPETPKVQKIDLIGAFRLSPLAAVGIVTIGMTMPSFRMVGPAYGQSIGLTTAEIATFMTASIIGGAVLQMPLGWASDRFSRRMILILATLGAACAGTFITLMGGMGTGYIMAGAFLFGAFGLPLYTLSIAHANDFAKPGDFVRLSASLMLLFSIGGIAGPFVSASLLDLFGPISFFWYTSCLHMFFVIFGLYRLSRNRVKPAGRKTAYVPVMRTSPAIFNLVPKRQRDRQVQAGESEHQDADGAR